MKNLILLTIIIGSCYKSTDFWPFYVQVMVKREFNYGVYDIEKNQPTFIPIEIIKKYGQKVKCPVELK